jgi:hypothetical protein
MRVDKNTGQSYEDFWHWLRIDAHAVWIISLVFAYAAYLMTTDEA